MKNSSVLAIVAAVWLATASAQYQKQKNPIPANEPREQPAFIPCLITVIVVVVIAVVVSLIASYNETKALEEEEHTAYEISVRTRSEGKMHTEQIRRASISQSQNSFRKSSQRRSGRADSKRQSQNKKDLDEGLDMHDVKIVESGSGTTEESSSSSSSSSIEVS